MLETSFITMVLVYYSLWIFLPSLRMNPIGTNDQIVIFSHILIASDNWRAKVGTRFFIWSLVIPHGILAI